MKKLQPLSLSVLSGLLLSFAWPATGDIAPLLFVGLVPLLFIEDAIYKEENSKRLKLFGYAFLAFLIWNSLTTYWLFCVTEGIATKILVVSAASLLNSAFMAIIISLFHYTKTRLGEKQGYISLIIYWLAFEYLHMNWELSWPWLSLGNGFANHISWIQWYEYTGILGGSLWIWIINILIFLLIRRGFQVEVIKKKTTLIIVLACLIIIPVVLSLVLLKNYEEKKDPVNIVIVQPNINPYGEKFGSLSYQEQLVKLLDLAVSQTDQSTDYIVAPETALTEDIWENRLESTYSVNAIKHFIKQFPKVKFVVGLSSYKMYMTGEELSVTARPFSDGSGWYDAYNSAMQIDSTDQFQLYHKSILVPGVEKMPYAYLLKPLEKLALDLGGTTGSLGSQEEPGVFASPDGKLKIAPVICYESVYGEYVGKYIKKGAGLIFVVTNDGWWDNTPGYMQHLAYARLRAVETRRSIARAANTGISCFINQTGEITTQTEWWIPTVIKGEINRNTEITFYARFGDYIGRISSLLSVLLIVYAITRALIKKRGQAVGN